MKFISRLFLVVLFPLSCLAQSSISDSAGLKNLVSSFNAFSTSHINEKVYVHIDKPSYFPGDTIWYKAYTVIGAHHQLSILSGVLHVELINQKDSVISRQAIQLISGTAGSDIPLPSGLKDGLYRIRAYTRWMRNAGPDYFYDRQIRIGFPEPSSSLVKQNLASKPDVQFFPEGGQLVNGVRSRIAVKSVGANGLGEDIKGTIEDNEGNVVADFATRHLGMGVFALIPQSGKTYKAKIAGTGEASFTFDLPQAAEEGLTLAINNSQKDTLFIKVAANEKTVAGEKNNTFYLLAQSGGKIYYTAQEKLDGPVYTAAIEKSRFPTGIVQFTLFSQSGGPVAERIAFIRSADTLKLGIASATTVYTTRQKVNINFDVKDKDDNPVTGKLKQLTCEVPFTGTPI